MISIIFYLTDSEMERNAVKVDWEYNGVSYSRLERNAEEATTFCNDWAEAAGESAYIVNNTNNALAERFCKAIRVFGDHPERLDNFEGYLAQHFAAWMQQYASTPEGIVSELESFGNIAEEG